MTSLILTCTVYLYINALVSAEELAGLMETAHLLRSPKNAERLLTALNRARAKKSNHY